MKAYDHITATYYLLAERLLRKRADALQASASVMTGPEADRDDMKPVLSPLSLSPRSASCNQPCYTRCQFASRMMGVRSRVRIGGGRRGWGFNSPVIF